VKRIALVLLAAGCSPTALDVEIGILFPDGDDRLAATDNVSITLQPDGFVDTFAAEGTDFGLEVELTPDDTERELAVFLAQGETLLAYGRTPPFRYRAAAGAGLQVLVAYPQSLSTLPFAFDLPDANTVAAPAPGYGMVAVGSDGSTVFLDGYTFDLEPAARLEAIPAADDGAFVGDSAGGAVRLSWAAGLAAQRFDVLQNAWTQLVFEGPDAAVPRPRAAFIELGTDRLLVLGGGDRVDTLEVRYASVEATPSAAAGPAWIQLDASRQGATAIALDFGEGPLPLVVGGDDPSLPRVLAAWSFASVQEAARAGPIEAWTDLRCVPLDPTGTPLQRVLCAGGIRSDAPTADALLVTVQADGVPEVVELAGLLPAAMADVLWQADDAAVYAQGDGRWIRLARSDLAVSEPPAAPARARGGMSVPFDTGITLVVGGTDIAGAPTNRWQAFAPALPGD
jgi:hypothetical protein